MVGDGYPETAEVQHCNDVGISLSTPPWLSSDGGRGRRRRKANPPQQALEVLVVPQAVHARIYMKIDKPVRVLFIAFLQAFDRAVVFSQADIDSGEEIGRDILLLR
jgi:hypothetical protein